MFLTEKFLKLMSIMIVHLVQKKEHFCETQKLHKHYKNVAAFEMCSKKIFVMLDNDNDCGTKGKETVLNVWSEFVLRIFFFFINSVTIK